MKKHLTIIKTIAFTLVLLLAVHATVFAQTATPNLNGKSFKIDLVDSQNNTSQDMLTFKETSFSCNAIANSTYTATRYQVTEQPDGKLFLYAIAISESQGTMTWKGHITGDQLDGGVLIEKPGQPVEKIKFTGTSRQLPVDAE